MRILLLSAAPCILDARPRHTARILGELGHDVVLLCRAQAGAPETEDLGPARLIRRNFDDLAPLPSARTLGVACKRLVVALDRLKRGLADRGKAAPARAAALTAEFWGLAPHAEALVAERFAGRIDAVHAVGLAALPSAGRVAERFAARLVYDAVELERDRNASYTPFFHHLRLYLERRWIRAAAAVAAPSPEIARQLARDYGVVQPYAIENIAAEAPTDATVRQAVGLGAATPLAVYVGAALRDRGLGPTIQAIGLASEFHFAVVGPDPDLFRARFAPIIEAAGAAGRVHPVPARRPSEAAAFIRAADVAAAVLEPSCASYEFALPNKLFQSVAAGLPIVVGRTATLRRTVEQAEIGESVDERDIPALADALRRQAGRRHTGAFKADRARFLARHGQAQAIGDWARLYGRIAAGRQV